MGVALRDAGNALRSVTSCTVRDAGNILRSPTYAMMRDGANVLRRVWQAGGNISISASPTVAERTAATRAGAKTVITPSVNVSATGGVAPLVYVWGRIDGDAGIVADSPADQATTFSGLLDPDDYRSATFRCTVTDALGAKAHVDVPVTLHLINTLGGGILP